MKRSKWLCLVVALVMLMSIGLTACGDTTDGDKAQYTVTFVVNGGSPVESKKVDGGGTLVKPTDPTKDGYTFGGWYQEAELVYEWDFATDKVEGNISLYAKWDVVVVEKRLVSFQTNGGTILEPLEVVLDSLLTQPSNPQKNGSSFVGWFKDAACLEAWNFATDKVTVDTTIYAKWNQNAAVATSVLIDFDLSQAKVSGGAEIAGTSIDGFNNNPNAAFEVYTTPIVVPGEYAVYFEAGKEWSDAKVTQLQLTVNGTALDERLVFVPTGAWDSKNTKSSVVNVNLKAGINTLKVSAPIGQDNLENVAKISKFVLLDKAPKYTYLERNFHYGAMELGEGVEIDATEVEGRAADSAIGKIDADGRNFSINVTTLAAGYYDFSAYAYNTSGAKTLEIYVNGEKFVDSIDNKDTLSIVEVSTPDSSRSLFRMTEAASVLLPKGDSVVKFQYATGEGNGYVMFVRMAASTHTPSEQFQVTFDANGGKFDGDVDTKVITVNDGKKIAAPSPLPTNGTKVLGGWYTEVVGTTKWTFDTDTVTADLTLYAKWVDTLATVSFNSGDGPDMSAIKVEVGSSFAESDLTVPISSWYTFAGLYEESTFATAWDYSKAVSADTTLYAKWTFNASPTYCEFDLSKATYEGGLSWDAGGSKIDWGQGNGKLSLEYGAATDGTYAIGFNYSRAENYDDTNTMLKFQVTVNGVASRNYITAKSTVGDWGANPEFSVFLNISLTVGVNSITIQPVDSNNGNTYVSHIYKVIAYKTNATNIDLSTATNEKDEAYTAGQIIDWGAATEVSFKYTAATGGVFALGFDYSKSDNFGSPDTLNEYVVYIDGVAQRTLLTFRATEGDWDAQFIYSSMISLDLTQGEHTIKIVTSNNSIDHTYAAHVRNICVYSAMPTAPII